MKTNTFIVGALLLTVAVLTVVVSASLGEQLLKVPLFEIGGLWVQATRDLLSTIRSVFLKMPDFTSPWTYIGIASVSVISYYLYIIFWTPLNRVKVLGDVGYIPEGKFSMKDIANDVRKRRVVGELPPVYPNGWFAVLESRDIPKPGDMKSVSALGKTLAVFRGEDGEAHILDAYCSHMGANIAVGGRVIGNCLQCPFHGWRFDGETGKCTNIPYSDGKIPEKAKVKSYTGLERNGSIYMWYHAEGIEPTWTPPEIEEIKSGLWAYRGRTEHFVNAHIEEIPENGADLAHLPVVHSPLMTAGADLRFMWSKIWDFGKHLWDASWAQENEPHIGSLRLTHHLTLFGIRLPPMDMKVVARQIGPGIVYLMFDGFFGHGAYVHSITPTEPLVQRVIHQIYIKWYIPPIVGKFLMMAEALMIERDIMIWNNKTYIKNPVYVKSKEDTQIAKHRRWYSQFYSENSPKLTFQKESLEW